MLYIVGTPIGNLYDLSVRQARVLLNADMIAAEDTRTAGTLMVKLRERFADEVPESGKTPQFISYYKDTEMQNLPSILNALENEMDVCVISQSGMPLISDPGHLLVKTLISRNIPFEVVPGPTAFTTALAYSGFEVQNSLFVGFLPKKESHIIKLLASWQKVANELGGIVVGAYESPNRINQTLEVIAKEKPELEVCVCRELTKKFEEIVRGPAADLAKRTYKGEITLLIDIR